MSTFTHARVGEKVILITVSGYGMNDNDIRRAENARFDYHLTKRLQISEFLAQLAG